MPVLDCGPGNVLPFTHGGPIFGCTCRRTRGNEIILQTADEPVVVNGDTVQPNSLHRVRPNCRVVIGGRPGLLKLAPVEVLG